MRQPTPRRWQAWRVTLTTPAASPATTPEPIARRAACLHAETPGPDGIRHGLVARVRGLIAAGEYDTPERWAAAEERILEAVGGR